MRPRSSSGSIWATPLAGVLAAVLSLAGCAGGDDDGASPATTATESGAPAKVDGVDAKAASSAFAVEGRDIRLVRVNDRELALQLELFNGTDGPIRPGDAGLDPLGRETLLADLPRRTVYGMLRSEGLNARISENDTIGPGGSAIVTAVFSAPPAEAAELLVMIGALEPVVVPVHPPDATLEDDPVLTGAAPATPLVSPILSVTETGGDGPSVGGPMELVLSGDVLFEFGSARLSGGARAAVALIAEQVERTSGTFTVAGHTDSVDDDASNQTLSEQRAAAVRDALQAELGAGFSYEAVGFGESRPVAANQKADGSDDPDGRALNRRVEVRLADAGQTAGARLGPRALDDRLAAAGLKIQVDSLQRIAGYILLRVTLANPTGREVELGTGDGFIGQNHAPDGVTLVDTIAQTRHQVGRWQDVSATEHYAGSFSNAYGDRRSGVVPPQAEIVFWGLYPAPAAGVTSMDVEIGGFGQVVPGQVIAPD